MTDFKKLRKTAWVSEQGQQGVADKLSSKKPLSAEYFRPFPHTRCFILYTVSPDVRSDYKPIILQDLVPKFVLSGDALQSLTGLELCCLLRHYLAGT